MLGGAAEYCTVMSEANARTVEEALAAFLARDGEAFADCFTEDAELFLPRNLLEGGGYQGHEGARRAIADAFETWADIHIRLDSVREAGDDQILIVATVTNVGKPGTPSIEYEGFHLARLRDGRIASWRPYASHREALEAAESSA